MINSIIFLLLYAISLSVFAQPEQMKLELDYEFLEVQNKGNLKNYRFLAIPNDLEKNLKRGDSLKKFLENCPDCQDIPVIKSDIPVIENGFNPGLHLDEDFNIEDFCSQFFSGEYGCPKKTTNK